MKDPLVSVIIPAYNRANFIKATMNSVWSQTYRPVEMIVIDDGSTDHTEGLVRNWMADRQSDENFKGIYIRQPNRGAPAARNKGAGLAQGSYLMFLDSDDLLTRATLANLIAVLQETGDGISACQWSFLQQKGTEWIEKKGKALGDSNTDVLQKWLRGWYIPPCALLWEKSAYGQLGGWDESLSANQDGDLVLRYLVSGGEMAFAPQGKSLYRKHTDKFSISEARTADTLQSRQKVLEKVLAGLRVKAEFENYKSALAAAFYDLSCRAYYHNLKKMGDRLYNRTKEIDESFQSPYPAHRALEKLIGVYYKEKLHKMINYLLPGRSA